ncbi:MAG: succinate dehydrogenase assembly factor 2 [Pseudomonadota bacterium]
MRREAGGSGQSPARKGEATDSEDRHRRLRWRCRRGLLELDLWLARFAETGLARLSDEECAAFEALLQEADADLLSWLQGREAAPESHARMVGIIRSTG